MFFAVIFLSTKGWSLTEITLPKPTGLYAVGTKAFQLRDSARSMLRGGHEREWMIQAYYPAKDHKDAHSYMPGTLLDSVVAGARVQAHAKPNAEALKGQRYPLIIFIPGRGNLRQQYTLLLEELASQGYMVLAMDQPYVANYVAFLDGRTIVPNLKDMWYVPRDRDYRYRYDDEAIAGAVADIDYLLSHLNVLGDVAEQCDSQHCILIGHSLGGNVAHTFGFKDKRIKLIVDIDSKITERAVFGHIGVPPNPNGKPTLFIRGMQQYQEDVGNQLTKIPNATIWSPDVEHSAFSDHAYLAAQIPEFGQQDSFAIFMNWLLKKRPYWSRLDTKIGSLDIETWVKEYRSQITGWLKKHYKAELH